MLGYAIFRVNLNFVITRGERPLKERAPPRTSACMSRRKSCGRGKGRLGRQSYGQKAYEQPRDYDSAPPERRKKIVPSPSRRLSAFFSPCCPPVHRRLCVLQCQ